MEQRPSALRPASGTDPFMLTDVVMPRMSGGELVERLAPLGPKMKVLFMSGYTEDTATLQGLLAGRVPFFGEALQNDHPGAKGARSIGLTIVAEIDFLLTRRRSFRKIPCHYVH